jgi:hypothetical protein
MNGYLISAAVLFVIGAIAATVGVWLSHGFPAAMVVVACFCFIAVWLLVGVVWGVFREGGA